METKGKEEEKNPIENFKFSGNWGKQSQALKERFPKLTTEDVKFENGKELDLIKRLETKLGKDRQEVIGILKNNYTEVAKAV